jgi:hypothetical protein
MKKLLSIFVVAALSATSSTAFAAGMAAPIQGGTSVGLGTSNCAYGVFDPSIADTAALATAYMAYSCNNPSSSFPSSNPIVQSTRLASSSDNGATWTDLGVVVNAVTEGTTGLGNISWTNEVPSLVYDAAASSGTKWKLFWFHYSIINGARVFSNSWIAYKEADTPGDLVSATEIKLFAGNGYSSANNTFQGTTYSPVAGAPVLSGSSFMSSDCIAFTEPGAAASGSAVYAALNCAYPVATPAPHNGTRTVLLKCADTCTASSAGSWAFAGVPVNNADANYFGSISLSGQDIYYEGTRAYISVSPVGNTPVTGAYQGCLIFQFTNIDVGAIARNSAGYPQPVNLVGGAAGSFNGACTRAQNVTAAGWGYGQISFSASLFPTFNFYLTGAQ